MPTSTFTLTANVPANVADGYGLPGTPGTVRTSGTVLTLDQQIGLNLVRQGYAQRGTYAAPPGGVASAPLEAVTLTANVPAALATQLGLSGAQTLAGAILQLRQADALALIKADVGYLTDTHGAASTGGNARPVSGNATLDFPSIASGASGRLTIPVPNAKAGDAVALAAPATLPAGISAFGFVSADGAVTVQVNNLSGAAVDLPAATWKAAIIKF